MCLRVYQRGARGWRADSRLISMRESAATALINVACAAASSAVEMLALGPRLVDLEVAAS